MMLKNILLQLKVNRIFFILFFIHLIFFMWFSYCIYESYYSVPYEDWAHYNYVYKSTRPFVYKNLLYKVYQWIYLYIVLNIILFWYIIYLNIYPESLNGWSTWVSLYFFIILIVYYALKIIWLISILKIYSIDEFILFKGVLYETKSYAVINILKYSDRLAFTQLLYFKEFGGSPHDLNLLNFPEIFNNCWNYHDTYFFLGMAHESILRKKLALLNNLRYKNSSFFTKLCSWFFK